jgi:hypothetical protein
MRKNTHRVQSKHKSSYRGTVRENTGSEMMEHQLSALNIYGRKLNTTNDQQQIYELTLNAMERTLGFEFAAFLIKQGKSLEVTCHRGYSRPLVLVLPLSGEKKGITVRAANTRNFVLVQDARKDEDYV